ncbi:MAG: hypothetical protein JNL08_05250 [Planctomycetes bacterium]|nr:hypothetical protein [Planctomycetota bacterium]
MTQPAATVGMDRLLHASPHRTVFAGAADGGGLVVRKFVVSGALADAEREAALGRLCAGPGVIGYLDCALDAASRRPCITTAYAEGADLARLVAERGALSAALACDVLAPVAQTLARLHSLRTAAAPAGVCHGDVKPPNLLRTPSTTLLLDFEHATPIGSDAAAAPERVHGNRQFQPAGEPPSAAFDVFGLGATLAWLLAGGDRNALPQHPDVTALVRALTAPDPSHRPTAAAAAEALRELASRLADDGDERALDAAARGAPLAEAPPPHRAGVAAWHRRARRVLRTCPDLLATPPAVPTDPAALLRAFATAARVLRHFPRHAATLHWRRSLAVATGRLLADAATHVAALRRTEEFDAAATWLREAAQLAQVCLQLPGGCPIPGPTTLGTAAASPLLRDPLDHLHQLQQQLAAVHEQLGDETSAIATATAQLDLAAAHAAIDAMAARHGGAAPTVARQRDQLHRLTFYLERIVRAQPNVDRLAMTWDAAALRPLTTLVAAATRALEGRGRSDTATGLVGLRSLQLTLINLGEEFPHLPQVAPAQEALGAALTDLTERAWRELDEASALLRAVPVPVRPLQAALSRLDTSRILEAFVDLPDRPRSQLQDAIEALRLRFDQARATRDRLAEGAEHALARGHWTTGLFDMERAVAALNPNDERDRAEAARLQQRLAEARQRRQEIDAAVRQNVELATRYATLEDDPESAASERLQVLAARRDCLHMLALHTPNDRATLYARDLRGVETQIVLEQASLAEQRLDAATDPFERVRTARSTVDGIVQAIEQSDQDGGPSGRLVRLLEHWQHLVAQSQRAVEERQQQQRESSQRRRRTRWLAVATTLTVLGVLATRPWRAAEAAARGRTPAQSIAVLPEAARAAATALHATARQPADAARFDPATWQADWRTQLLAYCGAAALDGTPTPARAFAIACWDEALAAAAPRLDGAAASAFDRATAALVAELQPFGVRPSGH